MGTRKWFNSMFCSWLITTQRYFIRSKAEPREQLVLSTKFIRQYRRWHRHPCIPVDRTRFRVCITNKPEDDESIMIGSDDISITLPQTNLVVGVNGFGSLIVGHNPLQFWSSAPWQQIHSRGQRVRGGCKGPFSDRRRGRMGTHLILSLGLQVFSYCVWYNVLWRRAMINSSFAMRWWWLPYGTHWRNVAELGMNRWSASLGSRSSIDSTAGTSPE